MPFDTRDPCHILERWARWNGKKKDKTDAANRMQLFGVMVEVPFSSFSPPPLPPFPTPEADMRDSVTGALCIRHIRPTPGKGRGKKEAFGSDSR